MSLQPNSVDYFFESLSTQASNLSLGAKIDGTGNICDRDGEVRRILARSAELVRGTATLGRDRNSVTLSVVARTVLENLILILWIQISEENARNHGEAALAELKRVARINLEAGNAVIRNRHTGEDATAEFLASDRLKNLPKRKNIGDLAKDAGVAQLYDIFYRFLSMETHGHEIGKGEHDADALAVMDMQAVGALSTAIGHAGVRWLIHRKRTDNETLRTLLGIGSGKSGKS